MRPSVVAVVVSKAVSRASRQVRLDGGARHAIGFSDCNDANVFKSHPPSHFARVRFAPPLRGRRGKSRLGLRFEGEVEINSSIQSAVRQRTRALEVIAPKAIQSRLSRHGAGT